MGGGFIVSDKFVETHGIRVEVSGKISFLLLPHKMNDSKDDLLTETSKTSEDDEVHLKDIQVFPKKLDI